MVLSSISIKKGLAPKRIHAHMVSTLGDTAPSNATVKRQAENFTMGKESHEDDDRCGPDDPQQQQLRKTLLICTES